MAEHDASAMAAPGKGDDMLLFDTGKKLEKAFTQEQFNALVEVLESREDKAATKEDVKEVKEDLAALELRLTAELQKHREETRAELTAMEARLRNEIEKQQLLLQRDIQKTKVETLQWTVGLMAAQTAAIIAAVGALIRFMR